MPMNLSPLACSPKIDIWHKQYTRRETTLSPEGCILERQQNDHDRTDHMDRRDQIDRIFFHRPGLNLETGTLKNIAQNEVRLTYLLTSSTLKTALQKTL